MANRPGSGTERHFDAGLFPFKPEKRDHLYTEPPPDRYARFIYLIGLALRSFYFWAYPLFRPVGPRTRGADQSERKERHKTGA